MSDYSINEVTNLKSTEKRNYSKLPVIDFFRINIGGVTGTSGNRHVTVYEILVQTHGCGEFKRDTDVAAQYGMKLPHNAYRTKEAAFAAAVEYKQKWGKATSKSGQKQEKAKQEAADNAVKEVKEKLTIALKAMGLSEVAIATIIANA